MDWALVLGLVLRLVGWIFERTQASKETRNSYYQFLKAIEDDASASVKLRTSAKTQRDRIMKDFDNDEKPSP
jgi:hypothetical protein